MSGADAVLYVPVTRSLGFAVGGQGPFSGPTAFGMAGSGGTAACADTATGLTIAVTKNRNSFGDYSSYEAVCAAVLEHVRVDRPAGGGVAGATAGKRPP